MDTIVITKKGEEMIFRDAIWYMAVDGAHDIFIADEADEETFCGRFCLDNIMGVYQKESEKTEPEKPEPTALEKEALSICQKALEQLGEGLAGIIDEVKKVIERLE